MKEYTVRGTISGLTRNADPTFHESDAAAIADFVAEMRTAGSINPKELINPDDAGKTFTAELVDDAGNVLATHVGVVPK